MLSKCIIFTWAVFSTEVRSEIPNLQVLERTKVILDNYRYQTLQV